MKHFSKKSYLNLNYIYIVLVLVFLIIGLYLRLSGLPGEMFFRGDHGQDFLIALRLARGQFFPLVGPILSLKDFSTPPTYYYFLSTLILIFKSESNIIYVYLIMNILSGIIFALYIKNKFDALTATIFFSIYMVNYFSVEQSHSVWQPYPVTLFISIAVFLMGSAEQKFAYWKVYISIFLFCLSFSIYFAAIILAPVFLYYSYKNLLVKMDKINASILTFLSFLIITIVLYTPWIISESYYNFPTFNSIIKPSSYGPGGFDSYFVIFDNFKGLFYRTTQPLYIIYKIIVPATWPVLKQNYINALFGTSLTGIILITFLNGKLKLELNKFLNSIGFRYILVGLLPLIFYQSDTQYHRELSLLPYIILIISYLIKIALKSRNLFLIISGLVLISSLLSNMFTFTIPYETSGEFQRYKDVTGLYNYLKKDIKLSGNSVDLYDFKVYTPNQKHNFEGQQLWYLFFKNDNYKVKFSEKGNDTVRPLDSWPQYKYVYLICYDVTDEECKTLYDDGFAKAAFIKHEIYNPYSIYLVKNPDALETL
jgi:hypothetical protein